MVDLQAFINPTTIKEKRRIEILDKGLDLFLRKGYGGATTSEIAKACNISQALFFHYYESKEKLYETIIEIGIAGPEMMYQSLNKKPLEFFSGAAEALLNQFEISSFMTRMFVFMARIRHDNGAMPQQYREILLNPDTLIPYVNLIEKGQRQGIFRRGDARALAVAFWGALSGIAEIKFIYPVFPIPDKEWILDILRDVKKL